MKTSNPTGNASPPTVSRRRFLVSAGAAAAAVSVVPREVLGGPKHVAPSERINLAYIGCGSQGLRQLLEALPKSELNIIAVCPDGKFEGGAGFLIVAAGLVVCDRCAQDALVSPDAPRLNSSSAALCSPA